MTRETYPELRVGLELASDYLEAERITDLLGLQPTNSWRAGNAHQGGGPARTSHGWVLTMPPRPAVDFIDLVQQLLEQIEPAHEALRRLVDDYGVQAKISLVGTVSEIVPAMFFDNGLLARLTSLRVSLDVDLFLTTSPDDRSTSDELD